ncbi:hypothetical protein [Oleiagrimonas sp. C23AA]|uniref:hypothetical protein n=1 Tax=Oleiagrimonas sp. C23AA TaxID=2719047 RepID=UPI001421916A|nr:hypothetical protein [Oleiagrimonas sp. C23AA]NII10527.1 hypothetical protein [Oleiagrimonas sp. C23AA]
MKARNLMAMTISALMFTATLGLFQAGSLNLEQSIDPTASVIDNLPVTNLPGIIVTPSAEDLLDAGVATVTNLAPVVVTPRDNLAAGGGERAVGASLYMPYYAFGTRVGTIGKE